MIVKSVLIDLDGVLYLGDKIIPGAMEAIEWLRQERIPHLFLTNTTSRPRRSIVEKLFMMGINTPDETILTPVVAARNWILDNTQGPAALFVPKATKADFTDIPRLDSDKQAGAACVVLGDLGEDWDYATFNRAFRLLMNEPKPQLIALGMTRYWRAPDGLRLDVAAFIKGLEYATDCKAIVLGKPSKDFFTAALKILNADATETAMIGDDIVGDVQGAQQANIKGILVKTGKFRPADLQSDITPDAVINSISELPAFLKTTN